MNKKIRLAIFGSGNGTNAQRICEYFASNDKIEVACIVYNRREAYIARRAENLGVEAKYFAKSDFAGDAVLNYLQDKKADYIILAGFLLLVPTNLLEAYSGKVINIHPALLPKYGGKGMYGEHVHQAVIDNHEKESGITIHVVDEHYDRGHTLFQATCSVTPDDTPETLAAKIHEIEQEHFPKVIEQTVLQNEK